MIRRVWFATAAIWASILLGQETLAQITPDLEQGLKPYGAFHGGDIDSVSMTSGNLVLHIPVYSFPQRGAVKSDSEIIYNNKSYMPKSLCSKINGCTNYWIWHGSGVGGTSSNAFTETVTNVQYDASTILHIYYVVTPDGASHVTGQMPSGLYETLDATAIRYDNSSGIITEANGIRHGCAEDTNGNQICATDTIGRTFPDGTITTDYTGCTGPLPIFRATLGPIPGPNGGTSTFKSCSVQVPIVLSYNLTDGTQVNGTAVMLQSFVLPDGSAWTFTYSSDGNGDLAQVTLPTGGTISYTWGSQSTCNRSLGHPSRWVNSRTVNANDGTGAHTWHYSWSGFNPTVTATVTDPGLNDTVYTITGLNGSCVFHPTQVQYYQGSHTSGTLLKTEATSYSYTVAPSNLNLGISAVINVVPTQVTTTWPNGQSSNTQKTYDAGFTFKDPLPISTNYYPAIYGKALTAKDYDFGGALLRQTNTSYLALSNSNYLNNNLLNLLSSVSVYDGVGTLKSQTTYGYDEYSLVASGVTTAHDANPPAGAYRGNQTSVHRWLNGSTVSTTNCPVSVSNGNLNSTNTFYDTGMVYQSTDPCGHVTTYSYSSAFAGAYVTQTNLPDTNSPTLAHHVVNGNYDFNTGLLTSFTDQNGQSSGFSYDSMWRISSASFPDGGQTNFYHPDVWTVERQQKIDATRFTDMYVKFDGLGRGIRKITANDESTPWDQLDTCYDVLGRVSFVSYPYLGTGLSMPQVCSGAGDATAYDALGRQTILTHSDGSSVQTSYTGRATKVSDEGNGTASVQRISQVDGLGRLKSVCEVTSQTLLGITPTPASCGLDISGTGFLTTYSFDALGTLLSVAQGGLNARSFSYDSLSHLTSAANPESGPAQYTYDANGNVITKTDARGLITTNTYDPLNRIVGKSYTDSTPALYFSYDNNPGWMNPPSTNLVGRLVEASNQYAGGSGSTMAAATVNSYDAMGRIVRQWQQTPFASPGGFSVYYTYDLAGDTISSTNGFGVTFNYAVNRGGRLTSLTSSLSDTNHPGTLYSSAHYNAAGALLSASIGNGVNETRTYDSRLRLGSVTDGSIYSVTIPSVGGYSPDNDILAVNDSVNGNWTFSYDGFNRLLGSNKNSGAEIYSYDYDRFGNRWHQNGPHSSSLGFDANNRITGVTGVTYDAAGNVASDGAGGHSYTFDAENRISKVDGGSTAAYVYDASGQRIRKTTSSGSVDYIYDLSGHVVSEINSSLAWNRTEVFAGSRHLATYSGGTGGTTYFVHSDWLGTERVRSTKTGSSCETVTSLPFGDWQTTSGSCGDPSPLHFTGKERDSESGLDYFGARYYGSASGRFGSADAFTVRHLDDPQNLDLYLYSLNNPVRFFDPDGRDWKDSLTRLVAAFTIKGSLGLGGAERKEVNGTGFKGKAEVKASAEINLLKGVTGKVTTEVGAEVSLKGKKVGFNVTATNASVTVHPDGKVDAQAQTSTEISVNGHSTSSNGITSGGSSEGEFTIVATESTTLVPIGDALIPVTEGGELSVNLNEATEAFHDLKQDLNDMFGNPGPPPPPQPPSAPKHAETPKPQ